MFKRIFLPVFCLLVTCTSMTDALAQSPAWTIDLLGKEKKPEKFENRKLGSEKMADKKFTAVRRVFQNTYTHYNYYYNANNKIKNVIERAKASQKDDYNKLLPYYPFTLDNTAAQKSELDSVIYKATAGILLHDLRNDWIDNMYLLMGKAFFLRKDFDSAAATFQFINYNLFPRKKNEDDSRIVGTSDASSSGHMSIANKEKQNVLQKVTAQPPSRNDALIWLARTLIEQNELGESAGLISTLQHDPNLPTRLKNNLDDVTAYWFYKQNFYDSTASYLEKALSNAETKQDLARSEFLLAQLYEMTSRFDKATAYYEKVSTHTVDPLMDIHARLNNAKMLKSSKPEELTKSINNLVNMAKKDRFESYRDILFYSAGELSMQVPDTNAAAGYYKKSIEFNEANISYKNRAFLQLADIAYNRREYRNAFAFYDSLQAGDTTLDNIMGSIQARRNALSKIVEKIVIIEREDSLQTLAAMAPAFREIHIKKIVKQLRKERGLKDYDSNSDGYITGIDNPMENKNNAPADLFGANDKSEWYFANKAKREKGLGDFKRKWGSRKNADNWRRKNAVESGAPNVVAPGLNNVPADLDKPADPSSIPGNKTIDLTKPVAPVDNNDKGQPDDISYESLLARVPTTPDKLAVSNSLIAINLFELANLYKDELEDYQQAINTYHLSLERFPDLLYNGELYLGLYYCYNKLGMTEKAEQYKSLLNKNFANSNSALKLNNPAAANPNTVSSPGTKKYESIYNLFIEGNFDKAFAEKKIADSLYGKYYWSPQLLYIEAVYHIKQKDDSVAIKVLKNITSLYPDSKLAPKATRMIDVLKRRKEIEDYLSKLEITRAKDDEIVKIDEGPVLKRNDSNLIKSPVNFIDTIKTRINPVAPPVINGKKPLAKDLVIKDTLKVILPPVVIAPVVKDTVQKAPTVFVNGVFTLNTETPQNVIMLMDKVDGTYVNESKNAFNRYLNENYRGEPITITRDAIDKDKALLVFTSFKDAATAYQFVVKIKKAAPDEVSWLPANKYSFYLVNDENLQLLKTNKDFTGYIGLLNKVYPGKF